MRVLAACEESGTVREAFKRMGHDAWSCDILPTRIAGQHIQGDVLPLLKEKWDMIIAFPPCTYLCVPGAHYLHTRPERWDKMIAGRDFFNLFLNLDHIQMVCIENPVQHQYAKLPKYNQIIQPWQFGHELSKRTALWLKGLPKLTQTDVKENHGERYTRKDGTTSNSKWYAKASAKERSKTFDGIADAMAAQWGQE